MPEFNKVLVSGIVLSALLSTTVPAFASNIGDVGEKLGSQIGVTQIYDMNYESTIYEIKATIASINEMKAKGQVTKEALSKLASQIQTLQMAVSYSDNVDLEEVSDILDSAEKAVEGVEGNKDVAVSIAVAREMLGLNIVEEKEESITLNNAQAAPMVKSFSDVKPEHWFYNSVMAMTQKGFFAGKGDIVDGVGTFAPNDTMTKAEFLTVTARILFDEDNIQSIPNGDWWAPYYNVLLQNGVITQQDIDADKINEPMNREEMALVSIKALTFKGESFDNINTNNVQSCIPDVLSIGSYYKDSVLKAYAKGILVGVDSVGTYNPKGVLDRASATTVLYRIVDANQREKVDYSQGGSSYKPITNNSSGLLTVDPSNGYAIPAELVNSDSTAPITIYEGEYRQNRPAKEGDIFIKKDGTQIVVQKDQYGIVGGGQGLQLDVGLDYQGETCAANGRFTYGGQNLGGPHKGLYWVDSLGNTLRNGIYPANRTTGEAHWDFEWQYLGSQIPTPTYQGTHGEVSKDAYHLYRYSEVLGMWVYNF